MCEINHFGFLMNNQFERKKQMLHLYQKINQGNILEYCFNVAVSGHLNRNELAVLKQILACGFAAKKIRGDRLIPAWI